MGLLRVTHDSGSQSTRRGPIVADIATVAAAMPATEQDTARKAALSAPVQAFFRDQAEPGRAYTMAEVGEGTGIGPADAMPLMDCLNMLAELGILQHGPPAGGAGPTWQRPIQEAPLSGAVAPPTRRTEHSDVLCSAAGPHPRSLSLGQAIRNV